MPICHLSELKTFLLSLDKFASKRLSQNFLIDENVTRKIIAMADLKEGDVVLELGPGPGALTECLLEHGIEVLAVEMDSIFAEALPRLAKDGQSLTVFPVDFLKFDFRTELKKRLKPGQKAKFISNLPYHITSPILERVLPEEDLFSLCVVMVQYEYAQRMAAKAGTKNFGSFSVFVQFYSEIEDQFVVSPTCFHPKPTVKSSVLRCRLGQRHSVADTDSFFQMTRTAFQQRRKMLQKTLKPLYSPDELSHAFKLCDIDGQARPETLSPEKWVELFRSLSTNKKEC